MHGSPGIGQVIRCNRSAINGSIDPAAVLRNKCNDCCPGLKFCSENAVDLRRRSA